jgi:hypothetical protein
MDGCRLIAFEFPMTNTVLLALVAATAATLGRITLAKLSRCLVREKLFSDASKEYRHYQGAP